MTIGELVAYGGWAMYPIYACSLAAIAIFVKKWFEFRSARIFEFAWLEEVLGDMKAGDLDAARAHSSNSAHPVSRVVVAMLETFAHRPDRVEAEAQRTGSLELQRLERHIGVLSLIAQIAPLLGLLGTVFGMVELFMGMQGTGSGQVDADLLSSGIWQALLTTAAGLIVAVPALAGYTFLNSRTDLFRLRLSDSISRVLTHLPPSAPTPAPISRPKLVREEADAV